MMELLSKLEKMVTYVEDGDLVNALALGIRLSCQILVYILEIRYGHILLEFLIENDVVINQLDTATEIVQGPCTLDSCLRLLLICWGRAALF